MVGACGGGVVAPRGAKFIECWVGQGEVQSRGSAALGMREEGVEARCVKKGEASFKGNVKNRGGSAELIMTKVTKQVSVSRVEGKVP